MCHSLYLPHLTFCCQPAWKRHPMYRWGSRDFKKPPGPLGQYTVHKSFPGCPGCSPIHSLSPIHPITVSPYMSWSLICFLTRISKTSLSLGSTPSPREPPHAALLGHAEDLHVALVELVGAACR